MKFAKKVLIPVNLSNEPAILLRPLKAMDFLAHCEVHFVHAFNTIDYTAVISEFPLVYPVEADFSYVEQSVLAVLNKVSKVTLPEKFDGKVVHRCLFALNPKDKMCDYINDNHIDLVIVPTRKKHGIFESSFAQYVNKHTNANMVLLKDQ